VEICDKILRREDLLDQAGASIEDHDVGAVVRHVRSSFQCPGSSQYLPGSICLTSLTLFLSLQRLHPMSSEALRGYLLRNEGHP